MDMQQIIIKKRDGGKLSQEELAYFVKGYVDGKIPDYQVSALLMAICFQGLDRQETVQLTELMRYSGDTVDLSEIPGIKVDKHSTGGVGDKTTLIVGPIAAACGVPIAKMSGRGLGFTGGTVDKLASIPGFQTTLEPAAFLHQVRDTGIAVIGQSGHITPADKKLYALRDVTGTVENRSLIASSIMSKKLAAGSDAIVLDVKCGNGAFMATLRSARELSRMMVDIGTDAGRKTVAVITDMNQPLGQAVGNRLEVREAIDVLRGEGPGDIRMLSLIIAGAMIYLGKKAGSMEEGELMAERLLESGAAWEKFCAFIQAQGGDPSVLKNPERLTLSPVVKEIVAEEEGFVREIDAQVIGLASQHAGAGRVTVEDEIDPGAGVLLNKKVGRKVSRGELLATVFSNSEKKAKAAAAEAKSAFSIGEKRRRAPMLIREIIE